MMTETAFDIFSRVVDLDPADRAAAIASACDGEARLRVEVESLLQAHDAAHGSFLDGSALSGAAGDLVRNHSHSRDRSGEMVGAYRLIREIGAGGMGSVWLAERADGEFEQRVAVKLIRRGMDSEDILQRFRHERQVLARLEHPNIARLIDGGSTADGLPYLVMEHVEGERIDAWCDGNRVSIEERVRLFIDICAGVQFAHSNLVVHRDLKPGNVLVTAGGTPKLLDFGIAKVLGPDQLEIDAPMTIERRLTPAYASPEQISGDTITTASDVYSLGVLLYELLTGRRPYGVRTSTPREAEREILDKPPTRPHEAIADVPVTGFDDAAPTAEEIARRRATDVGTLRRRLAGDLGRVLLMALRKEPERRYASASAFADDLRRWLAGEPVAAHADSRWYRARKFVGRNRATVAAAALMVVILVGGIAATTGMFVRSQSNLARALDAEIDAEDRLMEATSIVAFLEGMLGSVDPLEAEGRDVRVLREMLEAAAHDVEHTPGLSAAAEARIRTTIGKTFAHLGLVAEGRAHLERALELWKQARDDRRKSVADTMVALALLEQAAGELGRAEQVATDAIDVALAEGHANGGTVRQGIRRVLMRVALDRHDLGRAEAVADEALVVERANADPDMAEIADFLNVKGTIAAMRGQEAAAEAILRESLEALREVEGPDHPNVLAMSRNLAAILRRLDRSEEARALLEPVLPAADTVYGPEHANTLEIKATYANILSSLGRHEESERLFREVIAVQERTLGPLHGNTATTKNNLADLLARIERYTEATALFREVVTASRQEYGPDHPLLAISLGNLGWALARSGDAAVLGEAQTLLEEALAIMDGALPPNHPIIIATLERLATLYDKSMLNDAERLAGINSRLESARGN